MKDSPKRQKRIREPRTMYETEQRLRAARSSVKPDKRVLLDWKWVQANRARLEKQYAGRWIAVSGQRIVGVGVKLSTAKRQAEKAGVPQPFVTAFKAAKYRGMVEVPLWF